MASTGQPVLAVSGGVGGAKLALGLADILDPGQLHVLANTGDDFEHYGLHISPDIDTLLYTLSGLANEVQGWGVADETFEALGALGRLGGETWVQLGDRDLATHLWRTHRLREGTGLAQVTAELALTLGIASHIHPMSDQPVRTTVHSDAGDLPFQHYFVRERCEPAVSGFSFEGIEQASADQEIMSMLGEDAFEAIVICPSNPWVSIDPILSLSGVAAALGASLAPVVLVSPIVGGNAIKGPAAKMMAELGVPVTARGVAEHYCTRYPGLVDYFVIDASDATLAPTMADLSLETVTAETVMRSREDKQQLASFVLELAGGR